MSARFNTEGKGHPEMAYQRAKESRHFSPLGHFCIYFGYKYFRCLVRRCRCPTFRICDMDDLKRYEQNL